MIKRGDEGCKSHMSGVKYKFNLVFVWKYKVLPLSNVKKHKLRFNLVI